MLIIRAGIHKNVCHNKKTGKTLIRPLLQKQSDLGMYCLSMSFRQATSFVCLFDLILYIPSTIFQLNRVGSSWDEPVLS